MKTRLCPHQHLWVLFLYCSPTLNTNYAWSVSVCVCVCMCVPVRACVCVGGRGGGEWRRRLPPVLDSNLQPLNLHIKTSILKPSAGGLTRWDGIDRIGLDMMSGSSGVVCALQAACSQEEGEGEMKPTTASPKMWPSSFLPRPVLQHRLLPVLILPPHDGWSLGQPALVMILAPFQFRMNSTHQGHVPVQHEVSEDHSCWATDTHQAVHVHDTWKKTSRRSTDCLLW